MTTLKQTHQEFVEDLKAKDRSPSTILAYGTDIEQLVDFLAESKIVTPEKIKLENLKGFLEKLEKEDYTKKSISRKINSIKTFFRFLLEKNYVSENPATLVAHPKLEIRPPRILTQMEYRALRDACRDDTRLFAIVELLLQTGIRIGELRRLKISDVDSKKGQIRIATFGKHIERLVPLNPKAQKALEGYLKIRPETKEEAVFITKTGRPFLVRNIRASINRYFKRAGIEKAMVNDLRHTFIAHHLAKGASVTLISKIAGHKRLSTTEKYLAYIERVEKEKEELEEL